MEIKFIPAMAKPRRFPLHWKGTDATKEVLFSPSELYPPDSKDLVGCVQYVADRSVDVDKLFTHRWKLDQAKEAYELFDQQSSGKGVLLPA